VLKYSGSKSNVNHENEERGNAIMHLPLSCKVYILKFNDSKEVPARIPGAYQLALV
jgi:hypothetical protein